MNGTDCDCVVGRCSSVQHGGQLAAVASMRAEESQLAAYMRWLCGTCGRVIDSAGRTALHLTASCGHDAVVRWLLRRADANIDVRDAESGYTALHRSIFYGQIHVAANLIKLGANMNIRDHDGLTPIDHAMKDRPAIVEFSGHNLCEVYVWGTNNNYSLGTGIEQSRSLPELLDAFRKQGISIKQVAMHKFHSVFVAHDGRVFSCGHGQGGRLGLGSEAAALTPCAMRLQQSGSHSPDNSAVSCTMACVGRDHTVLLMENGTVWSCGLNSYHQLGHSPPPPSLLSPRQLNPRSVFAAGESVLGICASRFHTVIWGSKAVLTCGLNAGHLGHAKGPNPTVISPKQVTTLPYKSGRVVQVAASDGATVVAVERVASAGSTFTDIFLLHEFMCRKIASRLVEVVQLAVVGGHLDSTMLDRDQQRNTNNHEEEQKLQVLVLDKRGHLFLWQENATQHLTRCLFSVGRALMVTAVAAQTRGQLLLVTRDGEAFQGEIKVQRSSSESTVVRVKRLSHIHRAIAVSSDPKGRNFAVVQAHPISCLLEVPQMERTDMRQHLENLLQETSEDDTIHDIVFQVGTTRFPAHQYIVACRCEFLEKRMTEQGTGSDVPVVEIKDMRADVFRQILQFIYTNHCAILQPGECPIKIVSQDTVDDKSTASEEDHIEINKILGSRDPNSISAFEVYSKKNNKGKTSSTKQKPVTNVTNNPVRLVQEAAKRFGLSLLSSELEKIRYEDGYILMKQGCRPTQLTAPTLRRSDLQNLHNVTIRSEDGKLLNAHKCVLVARLEYFHSMLSGRWVETSDTKDCVLSLPLPYAVLEVLLDFLYTDSAPTVLTSEDLEFVSNVLVVADQLFVVRLKEAAEVALANLLTLRNVGQVLQLSGTYNAEQLKQCCLQYITLNLPAVLEARILESVNRDLLQDLTKYYCEFIPAMNRRIVTPYSIAPSHELLKAVNDAHPILPWDEDDANINDEDYGLLKKVIKTVKKKSRIRKSSNGEGGGNRTTGSRARNESVGSNNSWGDETNEDHHDLDLDDLIEKNNRTEPTNESQNITLSLSNLLLSTSPEQTLPSTPPKSDSPWVTILNNYDKHQRIVQARLKVATAARDTPIQPTPESFTRLVPLSRQQQGRSQVEASSPINVAAEFPELQRSSPPTHHDHSKASSYKHSENKKITKLSQKQRKKLAAEQMVGSPPEHTATVPAHSPPAWGSSSASGSFSLLDIMKQEMQLTKVPQNVQQQSQLSTSPGPGPNPWLRGGESPHQLSNNSSSVNFSDIVADEKKQKENWTRMRAKPLQLTQLEDKAIEDLLVFYNAAGATEERITVKRVITGNVAPPTWITSHH
ncbi:inhibitor of Bruton tyrosine kinase [Periplaneta americana]|uniref:inhibitor of Bruton tyrosine kinase n=1 Tax=Periplaneta americana TaxID=6978 RepID=UPI0037E7B5C1